MDIEPLVPKKTPKTDNFCQRVYCSQDIYNAKAKIFITVPSSNAKDGKKVVPWKDKRCIIRVLKEMKKIISEDGVLLP